MQDFKRTPDFDPRGMVPKKVNLKAQEYYVRAENPKGELGFYFVTQDKTDIPRRVKARGPSYNNLSVLPELGKGVLIADLIAILGSIDIVLGEVDR
jgi:NADH-quinone oxidoreductase subunit D